MNRREFISTTIASGVAFATHAADPARKLRVAVIGHTGHGDYGHGLDVMWLRLPETEIVAVADADPKGLAAAQKKLSVSRGFADYQQMLAETKPDIAVVAPRHIDGHKAMVLAAVEAGVSGIYMEKPMCPTLADADQIVAACEQRRVKLAIAHRNRYHPALPAIDRFVKEDGIGRLLELRIRGKEDARGGAQDLWVLGSHMLNVAHYFAGDPVSCSGVLLKDGHPASRADLTEGTEGVGLIAGNEAHARFDMERGVPVFFDSVARAGNATAGFGLQLIGARGLIDIRGDSHPLAHLVAGSPFEPAKEPRPWIPISSAGPGKPEPIGDLKTQVASHLTAGRDLIAAIREDRQPLCSARDGRTTLEMIAAVFESHRLDGQRVKIPLKARGNPLALLSA
jgi:predicted dehydrogenase